MGRMSRFTSIPADVKRRVEIRDSFDGCPCCVWCGQPHARGEAHFVPRSQGGLGIEENLLTLCRLCHEKYDGADRLKMRPVLKQYLQSKYPDWDESKLIYHKYEVPYAK